MTLQLPESFTNLIRSVFEQKGEQLLADLPMLIDESSQRWGITAIEPVPNLSYNFVAYAKRGSEDVILKIGVLNRELLSEMNTLKFFNGEGICQLLESDEEKGMFLLERLKPGKMLSELEDDDERTHIAVEVMQKTCRPVDMESDSLLSDVRQRAAGLQRFIPLTDWFDELKTIRPRFNGGTGPIPARLLERVEDSLPDLFAREGNFLLHGDFHHFNILSSERGWLVIDPKGVIGPMGYEIGPFMLNPWNMSMDWSRFKVQAARRVDIFHERLGWDREKIIAWALAHSILSACWDLDLDPGYAIEAAEIFAGLK